MKTWGMFLTLVSLAVLLFAPVPAPAVVTTDTCLAQIFTLISETQNTTFVDDRNGKKEDKLEADLRQAAKKLTQGRLADALSEMTAFQNAVAFAVSKGWITTEQADVLLITTYVPGTDPPVVATLGADSVIACIQSIGS